MGCRTVHSVTCTPLHLNSMSTHSKYLCFTRSIVHIMGLLVDESAELCDETHYLAQKSWSPACQGLKLSKFA